MEPHIQVNLRITKLKGKVPIRQRLISGVEFGKKVILKDEGNR